MRVNFVAIAAISILSLGLAGCDMKAGLADGPSQSYDAEAFFQTTSYSLAGGIAFSPDGSKVLGSSDRTGVFNAYSFPVSGGAEIQLTSSTTNPNYAVSYFPHDERILMTADGGGDELNHIYVREIDGAIKDITPGEKLKAAFVSWTADGKTFFVTSNERDNAAFDLYRYTSDDYSRTLVFENTGGYTVSAVSRDGMWALVGKTNSNTDSDVFLLEIASGTLTHITPHDDDASFTAAGFSPSGTPLVSSDVDGEFRSIYSYDRATSKLVMRHDATWDVSWVRHSRTGRYAAVALNDDGSTKITIMANDGSELVLPDMGKGNVLSVRFSANDESAALILNADSAPSNIHVVDLGAMSASKLTKALNPAVNPDDLVDAEVVRYASFDGLQIPGILYKPIGASAENKTPALVWVHGGPGGQSRRGYHAAIQHLVNHGYAVLAANNRGSSGYGKTFYHMDDKRHGDVDLKDIVYARKYLSSLAWVDGSKVGIIGGSYGGYMVGAALAFEPEAFDVGVNIFGVMNWPRTLKSIPPWWASFRKSLYDELGDPEVEEERLMSISPLFHTENIIKPLLVVQGANDPRVLQVESDELVEKVRANGVPVEYVLFPDEGHGFRKRENRITASNAYVRFLDRYLKGEVE